MLIQSIHYTFAPEDGDEAAALFEELQIASRKEPGIANYIVARSKEKPHVFALWEEYDDQAALDAHYASEHFQRLGINGIRVLAKERTALVVFPIA